MLLSDGLSRLPSSANTYIDLDLQVSHVQFSAAKIEELVQETSKDPALSALREIIVTGLPDFRKELPQSLRDYWSFRDEFSVENGIVLKGSQVVIPFSMQSSILSRIHEGHQGIEKSKLRATDCVYWRGISKTLSKTALHVANIKDPRPKRP